MKKPYEYAKGRFIMNPEKVIDISVYSKQIPGQENPSEYETVWRVAYTLDVEHKDKGTLYSDGFKTEGEARTWAQRPMSAE